MAEKKKYDSTVARIAGNLLSGFPFDEYDADDTIRLIREAVAMARGIVAETERTEAHAELLQAEASEMTPPTPDLRSRLLQHVERAIADLVVAKELVVQPATDPLVWIDSALDNLREVLKGESAPRPTALQTGCEKLTGGDPRPEPPPVTASTQTVPGACQPGPGTSVTYAEYFGGAEPPRPQDVCTCYVRAFTRVQHVTTARKDCPVHGKVAEAPAPLPAGDAIRALIAHWRNRAEDMERAGGDSDGLAWGTEIKEIRKCAAELEAVAAASPAAPTEQQ